MAEQGVTAYTFFALRPFGAYAPIEMMTVWTRFIWCLDNNRQNAEGNPDEY